MTVRTRPDIFQCHTDLDTTQIVTCRSCVEHHRLPVQPNKATVGANAFAHESGIHQDASSSTARRTRSCGRRTWADAQPHGLGKHSAATRSGARLDELASC